MKRMQKKLYKATQLLIELLSDKEVAACEVYRVSEAMGISKKTISRAKEIVKVKVIRSKNIGWAMTIPWEELESAKEASQRLRPQSAIVGISKSIEDYRGSSEWVTVETAEE